MIDFKTITIEQLENLEKDRIDQINNNMIRETKSYNEIINELRFNYGYVYFAPFLVNCETGDKFKLRIMNSFEPTIHLAFIGVTEQKQGRGTEMMKLLTELADKYGYHIHLEVVPNFGVGKRVLVRFYKKFGFVKYALNNNAYMRKPKQQ